MGSWRLGYHSLSGKSSYQQFRQQFHDSIRAAPNVRLVLRIQENATLALAAASFVLTAVLVFIIRVRGALVGNNFEPSDLSTTEQAGVFWLGGEKFLKTKLSLAIDATNYDQVCCHLTLTTKPPSVCKPCKV
jgi:hypothetical protein